MSKEDLHKTLERLRVEVSSLDINAGPVKDRVNSLISDLEHRAQDLDDAEHRATIHDRLTTLIQQIESEHPSITRMLEQILMTLNSLGI